jgi:predicted phage terminase large subunit-like protein
MLEPRDLEDRDRLAGASDPEDASLRRPRAGGNLRGDDADAADRSPRDPASARLRSIPSRALIDRAIIGADGLREFVKRAWPLVEPARYVHGWHIDAITDHLEAVATGEIRRLIINVPPGSTKSLLASVHFPAWLWTWDAQRKFICSSFDRDLALRDARKHRAIVEDDWYLRRWPEVRLKHDLVRKASEFQNTAGGFRYSCSVGGGVTGRHGDILIIDDPTAPDISGRHDVTRNVLDRARNWWQARMSSRFSDPGAGAVVLIMQRLHANDLTGYFMGEGGWTLLKLPMRYEREDAWPSDPRTEEGELLCPMRVDDVAVRELEKSMGPYVRSAQLQQRPAPAGGGIFKREWFEHRYTTLPDHGTWLLSWDCAFKGKDDSDFVCGGALLAADGKFYIVDVDRARRTFLDTCAAIIRMSGRYPRAIRKIVEDAANGAAIEDALEEEVPGIELVKPQGGKVSRANAVSGLWEAGDVLLPEHAPWLDDFIDEHMQFPYGANDDQVDMETQGLLDLYTSGASSYLEAMRAVKRQVGR